ncbi:hypothetical protein [Kangiella shandongensis]|uniref:hypothetical protein n=1 Tax=Kangiella shandongensis TaxID=2763258 RepID=UPI001CBCA99F|nr:hypothetical protein [Kangiella shandongensis]
MKCYSHINKEAVGVCRACTKGICVDCSYDTGHGLACKESCEHEVDELQELVQRNKQIYSIGQKAPLIPSGAMVYFMFTLIFAGWSIYLYITKGVIEPVSLMMGIGMGLIGVYVVFKNRKLQMNC